MNEPLTPLQGQISLACVVCLGALIAFLWKRYPQIAQKVYRIFYAALLVTPLAAAACMFLYQYAKDPVAARRMWSQDDRVKRASFHSQVSGVVDGVHYEVISGPSTPMPPDLEQIPLKPGQRVTLPDGRVAAMTEGGVRWFYEPDRH